VTEDATALVVDTGELTLGGTGLGFTSDNRAGLFLRIIKGKKKLRVGERGVTTIGRIHQGYDADAVVTLVQWDAAALAKVFPGHVVGTTVTIDTDTVPAGTREDTTAGQFFTFSWAGALKTITAAIVCVSISADQIPFNIDTVSPLTLEIDFIENPATNEILKIADT